MRIPLLVTVMASSLLGFGCGGSPKSAATPAATAVEPAPSDPPVPVEDQPEEPGEGTGTMMATEEGRMGKQDGVPAAADPVPPAEPEAAPPATGTGTGYGGGAGAPPPAGGKVVSEVLVGNPTVSAGKLTPAGVRVIVKRQQSRLNYCYEKELLAKPHLAGMVTIQFVVNALGYVAEASVTKTTLNDATAENCMVTVIRKLEFGKQSVPKTTISYPFIFKTTR